MINIIKSCNLTLNTLCEFTIAGISDLYYADTSNSEFIIENNIIVDIINVSWYRLDANGIKVTTTVKDLEEVVLDFNIPYIDYINKNLSDITKRLYSFLLITKENKIFFINESTNTQFTEVYNPNGFIVKQLGQANKSLFQIDYNYYIFNFIGQQDIIDVCSSYYSDLFLSSTQPDFLSIDCIWSDYDGWI